MSIWTVIEKSKNGKLVPTTKVCMVRRITNDYHRHMNDAYQHDRKAQEHYLTACYLGTTEEAKRIASHRVNRANEGYGSSGIRMTKAGKRRLAVQMQYGTIKNDQTAVADEKHADFMANRD